MDEYNPMDELGLHEDKQFVSNCHGFIAKNNNTRDLCAKFIKNGERLYDVLSRYEAVTVYTSKTVKEGATRELMKLLIPLLKANGMTDNSAYNLSRDTLDLMPGAERAMRYLGNLLPCFINTSSYEHHMMNVTDAIGFPMSNVNCSQVSFDSLEMKTSEARELREISSKIARMNVDDLPEKFQEQGWGCTRNGWDMMEYLDRTFLERLPEMDVFHELGETVPIGTNEKSYTLLEIRRQSGIDFGSTVYVGGGTTDHQALDIVNDGGGLAISFNGTEESVRGSNVSVISSDSIVIAVLTAEFYNGGIESVHELIDNWNMDYIAGREGPDKNLLDTFRSRFPKRLPEVSSVDEDNIEDIVERSKAYRKKFYQNFNYK